MFTSSQAFFFFFFPELLLPCKPVAATAKGDAIWSVATASSSANELQTETFCEETQNQRLCNILNVHKRGKKM